MNEFTGIVSTLYNFSNTPAGIIVLRIILVFLIGEAVRLIFWEFFGAIDSFLKNEYSQPFKRLSAFCGYIANIGVSVKLAQIFKNGYTESEAMGFGFIYGCIAIILHLIWVNLFYPFIKCKLKKKYNIEIGGKKDELCAKYKKQKKVKRHRSNTL